MDAAQTKLFDDHLDLAEQAARAMEGRWGPLNGMTFEDYRQHALIGLMAAARKWCPSYKKPFEHLARVRCRQAILDGIRESDEVGRHARDGGHVGPTMSLDWPAAASDSDRVTLLGQLLVSPRRDDQAAAYDALSLILTPLKPLSRAIVYMLEVQRLTLSQAGAILGYAPHHLGEMRAAAMELLRSQMTFLAKNAGAKKKKRNRTVHRDTEAQRAKEESLPSLFNSDL